MAGLQQGEKQLFEKFWRGTFKAVATPRLESIIITSITARKSVTNAETSTCQPLKADQSRTEAAGTTAVTAEKSTRIKARERKRGSRRRVRSLSFDEDLTPRPASKGKKKKKKSERKRRRKRSPSYSLSPVRKKKKKKKSSKKRKRNRSASKKRRHSSTCSKSKRKEDRKHKKRSRTRARRRRRYRRSESESSAWRCSSTDSRHLHRSAEHALSESPARRPGLGENGHLTVDQTGFDWQSVTKSACTTPPIYHSAPSNGSIVKSGSGGDILTKKGFPHDILSSQSRGRQDYDSGNDTSSPPSTKTNLSRSKADEDKKSLGVDLHSPGKMRFTDGDNGSDSGNSVTSYSSLSKPLPLEQGLANHVNGNRRRELATVSYSVELRKSKFGVSPGQSPSAPHGRSRIHSRSSSRSRSESSRSSGRSLSYSRSRSLSSRRSYTHSPSYTSKPRGRRSWASGSSHRSSSYSRSTLSRSREPEMGHKKYGSCEKHVGRRRKRHRRRSYSPMRKRRRDSPSHLEARRITSARKRPIPYYRPSPSSSSRSTSYSSWSSLFTRSRSRTRSLSISSYRSYSRSSWSTLSGHSRSRGLRRSRSRSSDSASSYGRSRR